MRKSKNVLRQRRKKSPAPPGWNKTILDLTAEAKANGRGITPEEGDWARDYERSLLPANTRFPRKGDVFEAREDVDMSFLTHWRSPFTGGGNGTLRYGERIFVADDPYEVHPILLNVRATNYEEVETRMVPLNDRTSEKYNGYTLLAKTSDLNTKFTLVSESMYERLRYVVRRFLSS
jgi:hypothetical protein